MGAEPTQDRSMGEILRSQTDGEDDQQLHRRSVPPPGARVTTAAPARLAAGSPQRASVIAPARGAAAAAPVVPSGQRTCKVAPEGTSANQTTGPAAPR